MIHYLSVNGLVQTAVLQNCRISDLVLAQQAEQLEQTPEKVYETMAQSLSVMRQAVKSLFANDMSERNLTPIIASHNLRELEDICDHVGLLHKGGILLSKDLDDMKLNIHKIQCVLKPGVKVEDLTSLDILKTEYRGSLATITVRGTRENVEQQMAACEPLFFELIPLSLEEIFISETEVAGYDIKKLIF